MKSGLIDVDDTRRTKSDYIIMLTMIIFTFGHIVLKSNKITAYEVLFYV